MVIALKRNIKSLKKKNLSANMKGATTMKRNLMILVGLVLALCISTGAYAFGGKGRGHGGWHDGQCGKMFNMKEFKKLNLTADQKTKLEALKEEQKKEILPLKEKMMTKGAELRALWLEDNPDADKIKAAQKEMSLLRDQMMDKMTTCKLAVIALLTPEQKAELQKSCKEKGPGKFKKDRMNKKKANDNK
jgi:Spy/CpxP family protein refolding chaperone